MPGLITHYICGEAVIAALTAEKKEILLENRQLYNVGTQGPDVFFYYYPGLIKKRLFSLGTKMHNNHFDLFIEQALDSIEQLVDQKKNMFLSYISGYLTHYCLDCRTHPYIYYKTGQRKSYALKEIKYSLYHRKFETAIDLLLLKRLSGEKPSAKQLWEVVRVRKEDGFVVSEILSKSISAAYGVSITSKEVWRAMSYMAYTTKLLQVGKGKRKGLMEGEKIVQALLSSEAAEQALDYLNLKKSTWHMPWDNQKANQSSFMDMFALAVSDSAKMVETLFDFSAGKISKREALLCFGNDSFASGLDANQSPEFRFSDIIFK